ncbi:MAG TPA: hypothetical protein VFN01_09730 [Marinobacter sp.]|uniref:hypothetical protein n=1 Tax=Marinobacter sp. TaxID=50741 RepID=UPI002D80276F|nr:hypothetical protein [Marinobacter sp.]HET8801452.1 hypothetical protein [Marinobacter sp.]
MKFYIRTNIGTTGFDEISENYYEALKNSFFCLLNAYQLEQKYDLVVSNYIELELEFNSVLVNHLVGRYPGWINHLEVQLGINRRLANFLSTCKTYVDQRDRHLVLCFAGDKNAAMKIKKFASSLYEESADYRLMEALRNHVQHHSLAVHESKIGGSRRTSDLNSDFEYKAGFYLLKDEILKNKKFKSSVRDEMPDKVDIISATRSYMSVLNRIQIKARKELDPAIEEAYVTLIDVVRSEKSEGLQLAKYAISIDEDKNEVERIPLLLTHLEEIKKLKKKNPELLKIERGHFSTDPYN